jgi:ABC-type lipoprotein release transport system permease subunit
MARARRVLLRLVTFFRSNRAEAELLAVVATVAIAAFIAGVTALACLLPARRALRIPPTEALREA